MVEIRDKASYDTHPHNLREEVDDFFLLNQKIPKIVALAYCSRRPDYFIWNAYFPIFLITILSFTIFSVDCKSSHYRTSMAFTILLTSITFKWVVNRTLPAVSYLTSLDKYSIACIVFITLHAVWHAIISSFWSRSTSIILDRVILGAFVVGFIIIHLGLLAWFYNARQRVREIKRKEAEFIEKLSHLRQRLLNIGSSKSLAEVYSNRDI